MLLATKREIEHGFPYKNEQRGSDDSPLPSPRSSTGRAPYLAGGHHARARGRRLRLGQHRVAGRGHGVASAPHLHPHAGVREHLQRLLRLHQGNRYSRGQRGGLRLGARLQRRQSALGPRAGHRLSGRGLPARPVRCLEDRSCPPRHRAYRSRHRRDVLRRQDASLLPSRRRGGERHRYGRSYSAGMLPGTLGHVHVHSAPLGHAHDHRAWASS